MIDQEKLHSIAQSWVGTPFHPHACVKGSGVDCVNLAASIFVEIGVLKEIPKFPKYSMDGGLHLEGSILEEFIQKLGFFSSLRKNAICGSLITFKMGRVSHHMGISLGGNKFIHTIKPAGTIISSLKDSTYKKRLNNVWQLQ